MPPAVDSLVPESGPAPESDNDVQATRACAQKLFAELTTRTLAFGIDVFFILLIGSFVESQILGVDFGSNRRFVFIGLMFIYFSAFWSSPLHATPTQFLFRMRVLHQSGHPLNPQGAMVRSAILVALWEVTIGAFRWVSVSDAIYVAAVIGVLLFFATIAAHRQGIHDLLARSVVVSSRSIQSTEQQQGMRAFLANDDVESRRHRRPTVLHMGANGAALAIMMFILVIMAQTTNDKNLRARVGYALTETKELQVAAAAYFEETARWPVSESETGVAVRHDYPDGGFYELGNSGEIRIQFEVKPDLRDGSIVLSPDVGSETVKWNCRVEGEIDTRYVPHYCRN